MYVIYTLSNQVSQQRIIHVTIEVCFNSFKGELHPKPKLSMFCALSQLKIVTVLKKKKHPRANCLRNSKMALKF